MSTHYLVFLKELSNHPEVGMDQSYCMIYVYTQTI